MHIPFITVQARFYKFTGKSKVIRPSWKHLNRPLLTKITRSIFPNLLTKSGSTLPTRYLHILAGTGMVTWGEVSFIS